MRRFECVHEQLEIQLPPLEGVYRFICGFAARRVLLENKLVTHDLRDAAIW